MSCKAPTTIRYQLTCLVAAAVLPVWLVSGGLLFYAYSSKCDQVNKTMLDTARSLTNDVDRELVSVQAALQALATSPAFATGDFQGVHRQTLKMLESYPGSNIVVADVTGQQFVNSFLPFGTPLPERKNIEMVRRIFESGKPAVSDLYYGAVTKWPMISIEVPVLRDGRVVYDLSMSLPSKNLVTILLEQKLPPGGYSSVLDSKEILVARSLNQEESIGKRPRPKLLQAMNIAREGTIEGTNLDGTPVFVTFCRSAKSGWTVLVGMPKATVMAGIYQWMWWAITGIVAISIFGIILAMGYARRISKAIKSLAVPALSVVHGDMKLAVGSQEIIETKEVAVALERASTALLQSEQRYRGIVDNQNVFVTRYLPGGIITFVNKALARMPGLEPQELLGTSFFPLIPEDDREQVIRRIESLSAENPIVVVEHRVRLPDGMHWQQWENQALFDDDRNVVEYQGVGRDVTEQKLADLSLRESEARYRAVVEDQSELITRYHPDGTYTFVNEAFCRYFGKTKEEVVGSYWQPDAVAEDIPMIQERLKLLSPDNPVVVIENRVNSGCGDIRWMQFVNRGFFDNQGALVETQAVGRDITEAKNLEEELRESEHRYSALFANKISAIAHCKVITDEKGLPVDYRILQVNEAYERIIGIRKADIEGRTVREVFPGVENFSFDYINILGKIALEGGEASYETFLEPTQQYLSIYTYSPSPGEFTTIFTDITDRKRMDMALRKSEIGLAEAQRVAHLGSWHWDSTADAVWWSDELYRIYEKTPGTQLPSFEEDQKNYTSESAAQLTAAVQEAMLTGEPYVIDLQRRVSTGPRRWVQARGEAVRNASGLIEGLRGTVQDISDRKEAEESLKMYARRLIVLEEDLRKRISRELHDDVGQELTALGLNLAHLARNLPDEFKEEIQTTLDDSRMLTKEISRSVRNLMAELRPSQLEEYGLASAIRSYGDQFSQRTGIAVVTQVAPQFPRLRSKTEIALFRITQEALNNISKHALASNVSISLEGNGATVRLSITDDGKGFLLQGSRINPTGSGWGLTIMKERAELIGGRFRLDSVIGEGTSITVEITEGR